MSSKGQRCVNHGRRNVSVGGKSKSDVSGG